jgi:hypothetical protein
MRINISTFLTLLLLTFCFGSCNKDDNEIIESDNYIFIEQHTTSHGEHISGPVPPLQTIDFLTYSYNTETKILNGIIDFEINKDLKLVYGSGTCLSGTAGEGCGTGLSAIYAIPYERGSFELLKTETDGNIIALFENEVINLAAGEEWLFETVSRDTTEVDGQISISEITRNDRITNFGFLKKSDIISWEW